MDLRTIFAKAFIAGVVNDVFDCPMPAAAGFNLRQGNSVTVEAGDKILGGDGGFSGAVLRNLVGAPDDLRYAWKRQIEVEGGRALQRDVLCAAMPPIVYARRFVLPELRFASADRWQHRKGVADGLHQRTLIALDHKQVVATRPANLVRLLVTSV